MNWNILDMYHGDNNDKVPNFAALKEQGCQGIIHKCTQGSYYKDPLFDQRIANAEAADLLVAAYHFGDASSVAEQIENFQSHSKGLFGFLDFERNPGSTMTPAMARTFMASMPVPAIYGSDMVRENAKALAMSFTNGLFPWCWLAEYGPHEVYAAPWTEKSTIGWQFSESGTVASFGGHVDLNIFPDLTKWGQPCKEI